MRKLRPVTIKMTDEIYMKLRRASFELDITMQDIVGEAILDVLKKKAMAVKK